MNTFLLCPQSKMRVRIRRSEIDKLACQAQSVRIFAESEYPSLRNKNNLVIALMCPFGVLILHNNSRLLSKPKRRK